VVDELVGLDGRTIRKAVAGALTIRREVAASPGKLSMQDLLLAARHARATSDKRGKA
jgi:pachytene checkpoint protein 2